MTRRQFHSAQALQRAAFADKFYPRLKRVLQDAFEDQVDEIASLVEKSRELSISAEFEKRWAKALNKILRANLMPMLVHGWQLVGEDLKGPNAPKGKTRIGGVEVGDVPKEFLQKADFGAIDKWIKGTSESASHTSATQLEKIFRDAADFYDEDKQKGLTPREIADQILFSGMVKSEARAKMLAHTGSIWSYNEGAVQRYEAEGVAVVEWLTANDDMACPFCADMNGKRIETGEPFFRSGDSFSIDDVVMKIPSGTRGFDVQHPPLHPNCRCTVIPVFEETA